MNSFTMSPYENVAATFDDWVSAPGPQSPCVSEASTSLEGAGSSLDFTVSIDDIDASNSLPYPPDCLEEVDWTSIFNIPHSAILPPPSMYSGISSNEDTPYPPSPLSDTTAVGSPSPSAWADCKFHGEEPHNTLAEPSQGPLDNFPFTFTCSASVTFSPVEPMILDVSDNGYWQPTSQQQVVAADPDAYSPFDCQGVEVHADVDAFAFTFTTPASPSPAPVPAPVPASAPASPIVKEDESIVEEKIVKKRVRRQSTAASSQPPAKRRRRQSTAPRYSCPHCDSRESSFDSRRAHDRSRADYFALCRPGFARTHNLKVHVDSVHFGIRANACTVPGCNKEFSRKHDLTRHIQSKHTDLGSPRRKNKADE